MSVLSSVLHEEFCFLQPQVLSCIRQARELIESVLLRYEKAGVVWIIENHERHSTDDLTGMVNAISSPYVGICMDMVNSFGALESNYPEQVIKKLVPHVVCVHYKDFMMSRALESSYFIAI